MKLYHGWFFTYGSCSIPITSWICCEQIIGPTKTPNIGSRERVQSSISTNTKCVSYRGYNNNIDIKNVEAVVTQRPEPTRI
jgi:hypothetical protein